VALNTGCSRKKNKKFEASEYCNGPSRSHAFFSKMFSKNCFRHKGQYLNTATKYSLFCSNISLYIFILQDKFVIETKFGQKPIFQIDKEKQCSMCPPQEQTTDNSYLDQCSIAPSISSQVTDHVAATAQSLLQLINIFRCSKIYYSVVCSCSGQIKHQFS